MWDTRGAKKKKKEDDSSQNDFAQITYGASYK